MAKSLQEVYNESEADYKSASVLPRWMPPNGDYTVAMSSVIETVIKDELVIFVIGTIADGEWQGRQFVLTRSGAKTRGMLKEVAEVVLSRSSSIREDVEALKAACTQATLVAVTVDRTTAKNGKEYANAHVNDVIKTA